MGNPNPPAAMGGMMGGGMVRNPSPAMGMGGMGMGGMGMGGMGMGGMGMGGKGMGMQQQPYGNVSIGGIALKRRRSSSSNSSSSNSSSSKHPQTHSMRLEAPRLLRSSSSSSSRCLLRLQLPPTPSICSDI